MEEKCTIQYKKYLQNFIHIFQYINIIFIILGIIAIVAPLEWGFKLAGALLVILAGCISYLMYKTRSFELTFALYRLIVTLKSQRIRRLCLIS